MGFSSQEGWSVLPFPPPIRLIGGCKIPPDCVPLVRGSQASFLPDTVQDLIWLSLSLFPGTLLLFRASDGKTSTRNATDPGSIPGSGRCPGEGNGSPLQCSCLENPMDGGGWRAIVRGVTESRT